MQKLTFTNSRDQTLIIEYGKPYMLQNLIGLSDAPFDLYAVKGYQQDGQTAAGQFFQARSISFSVTVFGPNLKEVFRRRRELLRFLNPKEKQFTVIYENDYKSVKFVCRVDTAPGYASTQSSPGTPQTCTVSLICDNPFLLDVSETEKSLNVLQAQFHFPLIFTPTILFSTVSNQQIFIDNQGDVPAPVRIVFLGPAVNPRITNENTGEFIQVNQSLEAGETLTVTTAYGNKRVSKTSISGEESNAFQYIDLNSVFWQLEVGQNTVSFTDDSGGTSAAAYIYHRNQYVGV